MKNFLLRLDAIFIAIAFFSNIVSAQWSTDPSVNNPICVEVNSQINPKITSDGDNGAIIVWSDERGTYSDIFAQRIDKYGIIKWTTNGDTICNAIYNQVEPDIVSDDNGGAIIVWKDFRTGIDYDIYAQRVDAYGNRLWGNDGVAICTASGYQEDFDLISDKNGGAIIVWEDARINGDFNIYGQRISSTGNVMWASNGIAICSDNTHQQNPKIIGDGNGNSIITWEDNRNGFADIYAQKVTANGEFSWIQNGIPVCTAAEEQLSPILTGNGNGGAIIVWRDHRSGFYDLFAQKVDSLGVVQWQTNGVRFLQASSYPPDRLKIVSDNNGGAIVCWDEDRTDQNYDIFAQRISNDGSLLWSSGGIYVCGAEMGQTAPQIIEDGSEGVIISWYDYRNQLNWDIYAQKVSLLGEFYWTTDGVPVSTASSDQMYPEMIGDGDGGAIIVWTDYRNFNEDIYTQKLNKNGSLGNLTIVKNDQRPVGFSLEQNYPNPFNPSTTITFSIPTDGFVSLKVFNTLGEQVSELVNETKTSGSYSVSFNAKKLTSGVYFYKLQVGNPSINSGQSFVEIKKMMLIK